MNNSKTNHAKISRITTVTDIPLPGETSDTIEDAAHSFEDVMEMHSEFVRAVETGEAPLTNQRDVLYTTNLVYLLNSGS